MDEFQNPKSPMEEDSPEHQSTLRTVPSFAIYNSNEGFGEEDNDPEEVLTRTVTIGDSIEAMDSGEFSFGKNRMDLIEEEGESEKESVIGNQNLSVEEEVEPASPSMYLAAGLGLNGAEFGSESGSDNRNIGNLSQQNLHESGDDEEYYRRMVDEYPCHPLFLRNYAQLLQSKGDLQGAEEYFIRATLADPDDGEILMQCAKLVWECHRDKDIALSYFERAAEAAPLNSHILAGYASFLWETEDDKEESEKHETKSMNEWKEQKHKLVKHLKEESEPDSPFLQLAAAQKIDAADLAAVNCGKDGNVEDYYKKVIDENPTNPLFLKNYARFLIQSKGDLQSAEEYYARAILADPGDGEILSEYAKLEWELHHGWEKTSLYFERAVQATPKDSNVLAAYACFLWETDDGETEISGQSHVEEPLLLENALTAANA